MNNIIFLIFLSMTTASVCSTNLGFHQTPVCRFGFFTSIYQKLASHYPLHSFDHHVIPQTTTDIINHERKKKPILRVSPIERCSSNVIEKKNPYRSPLSLKNIDSVPPPPTLSTILMPTKKMKKKEEIGSFQETVMKKKEKITSKRAILPPVLPSPISEYPKSKKSLVDFKQKMFVVPPPPEPTPPKKKQKENIFLMKIEKTIEEIITETCSIEEKEDIFLNEDQIDTSFSFLRNITFLSIRNFYQIFSRYVVIDTEATGLGHGHKMTEIGCVVIEGMKITGEQFHSLIDPQRHVSPSAHKITGYTQNFLSKYPTFGKIAPFVKRFISNDPIILHNAHFDLKLIREGFKSCDIDIDYEKTHTIIDTLTLARKNSVTKNLKRKNNLTELCYYFNISTSDRYKHGARIDALLTAQAFLKLIKEEKRNFIQIFDWSKIPKFKLSDRFSKVNDTRGTKIFAKFGIKTPLPESFLYSEDLYHEQLDDFLPALIIPFFQEHKKYEGIFIKYDAINPIDLKNFKEKKEICLRHFYGKAKNTYAKIFGSGTKTLFIGGIINSLLVRDALQENNMLSILNIMPTEYEVRGVLNEACFEQFDVPKETRQIFFLIDSYSKEKTALNKTLSCIIRRFCHAQFISFYNVILKEKNLLDWQVKYNQNNWTVTQDDMIRRQRIIKIENDFKRKILINYRIDEERVVIDKQDIIDPNTEILFYHPKITIRCVTLRKKENKITSELSSIESTIENTVEALKKSLELKNLKDLVFLQKIDQALKIYNKSLSISKECVVQKYCDSRGFYFSLPNDFRYMEEDYHPWLEGKYPVLIVPLYNTKNKIAGIHRIFFNPNGSPLPKRSTTGEKIPIKLSLGKTVACANEIYKKSILNNEKIITDDQAELVMLSEGFENGLIVRDTLKYLSKTNPSYVSKIYDHFGIKDIFSIKGCVGINGLIDIPLYEKTQTVVLLADNDGNNESAKATIRQTVEKFLSFDKKVYLVFPQTQPGEKIDINDLFLREKENPFYTVGELLLNSVQIYHITDLGDDNKPLQDVFFRLKYKTITPQNIPQIIRPCDIIIEQEVPPKITEKPFVDIPITIDEEEVSKKKKQDLDLLANVINKEAGYLENRRYFSLIKKMGRNS